VTKQDTELTKVDFFSFQRSLQVTHHGKRVVPLTGVLLNYPESVVLESSVKPSPGKQALVCLYSLLMKIHEPRLRIIQQMVVVVVTFITDGRRFNFS